MSSSTFDMLCRGPQECFAFRGTFSQKKSTHERTLDFGERRNIRARESLFSTFRELGLPLFSFGKSEGSVAFPFSVLGHSRIVKMGRFLLVDVKRIFFIRCMSWRSFGKS